MDAGSSPTNVCLFLFWYFPLDFYSSSSVVVLLFSTSNSPSSSHVQRQHWCVINEIAPVRDKVWRRHVRIIVIGVRRNTKTGFPSPPLDLQLLEENTTELNLGFWTNCHHHRHHPQVTAHEKFARHFLLLRISFPQGTWLCCLPFYRKGRWLFLFSDNIACDSAWTWEAPHTIMFFSQTKRVNSSRASWIPLRGVAWLRL